MRKKRCSSRRRRHTLCTVALVAAATLIFLTVNAGMAVWDGGWKLRIDISKEQYTMLTDESRSILSKLDRNVYLYDMSSSSLDDLRVTGLLENYAASSPHVFYSHVDPSAYPGFTQLYDPGETGIAAGSVIVSDSDGLAGQAPGRFKVFSRDDLYLSSAPYYDESGALVSDDQYFRAEQKITSAIDYIMTDKSLTAVFLSGQGEPQPLGMLTGDLNGLFFETRISDLTDAPLDPQSDTLIVISPQSDLSDNAYRRIGDFLSEGGKALFFIDAAKAGEANLARFETLLSDYGLFARPNMVADANPVHTYMSCLSLIPSLNEDSPITAPVAKARLTPVLTDAGAITVSSVPGVDTSVLLETEETSYAKTPEKGMGTYAKEAGDEAGPFVIGALSNKGDAAVALFGSSSLVSTEAGYGIPGNERLFLNTVSFLNGREESGVIPMRTIYSASDHAYKLDISSEMEKVFYIALTAAAVPLAVLLIGISVVCKRRRL